MTDTIITSAQCRAARALLNWSQPELAEHSGLTVNPIVAFEKDTGSRPAARTMRRMVQAFELAGVAFTANGGVEPSASAFLVLEGENANYELLEDIYHSLKETGGEVLIAGLAEPGAENQALRDHIAAHIERMQGVGVSERILIEHGDTNVIAPRDWYRWITGENFSAQPFQLYGDKLALIDWGPPQKVVIIHHARFAQTFRNLFDYVWERADPVATGEGGS